MKNLALIATAAVILMPVAAHADVKQDNWFTGATTYKINVKDNGFHQAPFIPNDNQRLTTKLKSGAVMQLDGHAAYILNKKGGRYIAPNEPHKSVSGVTYTTEDGIVLYAEPNPQPYLIKAVKADIDNDGIANEVDYRIHKMK